MSKPSKPDEDKQTVEGTSLVAPPAPNPQDGPQKESCNTVGGSSSCHLTGFVSEIWGRTIAKPWPPLYFDIWHILGYFNALLQGVWKWKWNIGALSSRFHIVMLPVIF